MGAHDGTNVAMPATSMGDNQHQPRTLCVRVVAPETPPAPPRDTLELKAIDLFERFCKTSRGSFLSIYSMRSALSLLSAASAGAMLSLLGVGSMLSVASFGSVASVGSFGSVASVGSFMSIGCVGGSLQICW